ncbi:MAG: hypothetical protein IT287_08035 [Bdellovibrionaceae bacterium]|nr:hypothetical protein [Pseudobdellovibrionaceae bacterium]
MLSLLLISLLSVSLTPETPWWVKPAYQKKVREQRELIVSIKSEGTGEKSYYKMTGAGIVRATREFTLKKILAFEDLQKISPYFKKVVHEPHLNRVYLLLEAYGYEARLLIKYSIKDQTDKTVFHWSVVWGGFQGMIGDIELSSLGPEKTEAILISTFDDKQVPLPSIFKGVVLEIIVQHVAKSMRSYIEEEYEKSKGKP